MGLGRQEHILIISHDVVGRQMAGPGIRYFHLARVLAREFAVVLAVPEKWDIPTDFSVFVYADRTDRLAEAIESASSYCSCGASSAVFGFRYRCCPDCN